MTSYDVYIGDLDEYHTAPGDPWAGNFPNQVGPSFPPKPGDSSTQGVFREVLHLPRDRFEVNQTDWGCWVAIIKPDQLLVLLDAWYGSDPIYPPKWTLKDGQTLEDSEIRQFVQTMDQSKKVALVALES
jgi:hypothetical protein